MLRIVRILLVWLMILAMTVTSLAVLRPDEGQGGALPSTGAALVLQNGTPFGLLDGRLISSTGSRYADNGALLVPLRSTVTALCGTVTVQDNAVTARSARGSITFTTGSWSARSGSESVTLPAPPVMVDGSLYVPALALQHLGWIVHTTGYYDGDLVLISRARLTEERQDAALASALEVLGPNRGLFQSSTVLLRLNSRWSIQNGKTVALSELTNAVTPRQSGSTIQVPLTVCAKALGYTVTPSAGQYLVTGHGQALTFSADTITTADLTTRLGGHVYTDSKTGAILVSAHAMGTQSSLRDSALQQAGQLTLLDAETAKGYIALTFDDGPSGAITTTLLDGLKARNAHATFFLCNYRLSLIHI